MANDNATIGISKTYSITLPGEQPYTYKGTPEDVWAHVETAMRGRGGAPSIEEVTGEQPAQDAPQGAQAPADDATTEEPTARTRTGEGETDEQRLARVEEDRAKLAELGFSLGQPFHDRGVAGVGSGGQVRRSATEHEAKPRVPEAVEQFCEAVRREERRDVIMPTTELVMRADGNIVGEQGATWPIEAPAMKQLASRLGISNPAALEDLWPRLRATVWNQHIATALGHESSTCPATHPARKRLEGVRDRNTLCRTRIDGGGQRAVWAALGERYTAFDVDRVARELEKGMRAFPEARCEIQYDGVKAQADVMFHSDVEPAHYSAGEVFKMGIRVKANDAGGGSILVGLSAYQSLCTNMMMVTGGAFTLCRLRHIGSDANLAEKFEQAMRNAQSQIEHFLKRWGYACEETLAQQHGTDYRPEHLRLLDELADDALVSEADLLTGIYRGIAKTGAVSLHKDDLPGLLAAHAKDESGAVQCGPVTRASVVNAITRHAHEHVGKVDPLRQQALEAEAGALLVSSRGGNPAPLPFLPPRPREVVHA
jgi:hypothetical protein